MFLEEGKKALEDLKGKKFGEIFNECQLEGIVRAKGKSGQILELAIGLKNTSYTLDFEDGELKTNKCSATGKPLETMFITQINSMIDELLNGLKFEDSKLYKKISNLLYVPISKEGNPEEWFILDVIHINLHDNEHKEILAQLEADYYSICNQLKVHIETSKDGFIHTSNGKFIQIRSKDSKPYRPIYSQVYGREVSNKNHAFYFKKEFMQEVREMARQGRDGVVRII